MLLMDEDTSHATLIGQLDQMSTMLPCGLQFARWVELLQGEEVSDIIHNTELDSWPETLFETS